MDEFCKHGAGLCEKTEEVYSKDDEHSHERIKFNGDWDFFCFDFEVLNSEISIANWQRIVEHQTVGLKVWSYTNFGDISLDQDLLADAGIGEHCVGDTLDFVVEQLKARLLDRLAELKFEEQRVILLDVEVGCECIEGENQGKEV